jgi:hypothetical protein
VLFSSLEINQLSSFLTRYLLHTVGPALAGPQARWQFRKRGLNGEAGDLSSYAERKEVEKNGERVFTPGGFRGGRRGVLDASEFGAGEPWSGWGFETDRSGPRAV